MCIRIYVDMYNVHTHTCLSLSLSIYIYILYISTYKYAHTEDPSWQGALYPRQLIFLTLFGRLEAILEASREGGEPPKRPAASYARRLLQPYRLWLKAVLAADVENCMLLENMSIVYAHGSMQACMYVYTHTHMYAHIHLYKCLHTHIYTYIHMCIYINTFTHMYVHTYTYTYRYICTYICTYISIYT